MAGSPINRSPRPHKRQPLLLTDHHDPEQPHEATIVRAKKTNPWVKQTDGAETGYQETAHQRLQLTHKKGEEKRTRAHARPQSAHAVTRTSALVYAPKGYHSSSL